MAKDKTDVIIINDDLVFEVELLKQVDINIDYILMLVQKKPSRFTPDNECGHKKDRIFEKLRSFFERYVHMGAE